VLCFLLLAAVKAYNLIALGPGKKFWKQQPFLSLSVKFEILREALGFSGNGTTKNQSITTHEPIEERRNNLNQTFEDSTFDSTKIIICRFSKTFRDKIIPQPKKPAEPRQDFEG